jgi:hypothetical protein
MGDSMAGGRSLRGAIWVLCDRQAYEVCMNSKYVVREQRCYDDIQGSSTIIHSENVGSACLINPDASHTASAANHLASAHYVVDPAARCCLHNEEKGHI